VAILDETDSGRDIDRAAHRRQGVQRLHDEQGLGPLIIPTTGILHYVKARFGHILMDGGSCSKRRQLVERLEREGYDQIRQEVAPVPEVPPTVRRRSGAGRTEASLYHALAGTGAGKGARSSSCARPR